MIIMSALPFFSGISRDVSLMSVDMMRLLKRFHRISRRKVYVMPM
jgi:hypothetical protein